MRRFWIAALILLPAPLAAAPVLTVTKTTSVAADGISLLNPKAIPGASVDEMVTVTSPLSNGLAAIGSVVVTDTIPTPVKLCLADLGSAGSGPVEFVDGSLLGTGLLGSGLGYRFVSLASASDGVDFSSDGTNWGYVPAADANGCDARVRAIRVTLSGNQAVGSSFRLRYRVIIR